MPVYPGDSAPKLTQMTSFEKEGYVDHQLTTGVHVGTHIDAPLHMVENGKRLSDFPIERFMGRGVLVDARNHPIITAALVSDIPMMHGDIVLLWTGMSAQYHQPSYYDAYPVMDESCARLLVDRGVGMICLDAPSPDRTPFAIHKLLLSHDILIAENCTNFEALDGVRAFDIIALPLKLDTDAAPARIIARVP